MVAKNRKDKLALATSISQNLKGPSEAIVGFHNLLIEEVRRTGPEAALEDLQKIGIAASNLVQMVEVLGKGMHQISADKDAQAKLRHDFRSPINAIIGYSEMVLDDFEVDLEPSACRDINAILNEARRLALQIDVTINGSDIQNNAEGSNKDEEIAASLERSLTAPEVGREILTGHILVIDDEAANREILTRLLERRGHSVRSVGSARETYKSLKREGFDLVLLDILMPEVNGIDVLERMKEDPSWREIPVVMVSGLNETDAIAKCISVGAEDYLPKPIDPVLLHARVDACLERSRWRAKELAFTNEIKYERDRADKLLHSMLPAPVIKRLNDGETNIADRFVGATIIFADIVEFTPLVARMDAGDLILELSRLFTAFDDLATMHGIEKIKTIGDAYMAASGIPLHRKDHAHAAISFARDILRTMSDSTISSAGLQIRIGVHSGPVIAGLIGRKRSIYDVWGETVNLASRLEATGRSGHIHISAQTKDALGDHLPNAEAQTHFVKGVGEITSYFVA
ncbi:adenylate/guanylate cyclase domain-containing protein [Ruegeria arenilitoris]|uniref:adenylate/guanylate cyclase domain-containing protein n=1 Tax=Ruegeria arenilitoris TaxID=1173585 RepID=UPI001481AB53|nr:adenylate/guanylate cyclase domain-containing protein [Ruegeria arenilitoris]